MELGSGVGACQVKAPDTAKVLRCLRRYVRKYMRNKTEVVAMILTGVFLLALIVSSIQRVGITGLSCPSLFSVVYGSIAIIAAVIRVGCGWWLYTKSKVDKPYPWLWCLLGVVVGLIAVATYYIIEIYRKVSTLEKNQKETYKQI